MSAIFETEKQRTHAESLALSFGLYVLAKRSDDVARIASAARDLLERQKMTGVELVVPSILERYMEGGA